MSIYYKKEDRVEKAQVGGIFKSLMKARKQFYHNYLRYNIYNPNALSNAKGDIKSLFEKKPEGGYERGFGGGGLGGGGAAGNFDPEKKVAKKEKEVKILPLTPNEGGEIEVIKKKNKPEEDNKEREKNNIMLIQTRINKLSPDGFTVKVDGIMGPETLKGMEKVKVVQRAMNTKDDGNFGPVSQKAYERSYKEAKMVTKFNEVRKRAETSLPKGTSGFDPSDAPDFQKNPYWEEGVGTHKKGGILYKRK